MCQWDSYCNFTAMRAICKLKVIQVYVYISNILWRFESNASNVTYITSVFAFTGQYLLERGWRRDALSQTHFHQKRNMILANCPHLLTVFHHLLSSRLWQIITVMGSYDQDRKNGVSYFGRSRDQWRVILYST